MDAVIRALHVDFAKDMDPAVVAIIYFTKSVFKHNMCRSHYSLTNKSSTVTNESIKVSTIKPITESSTVTTNLFTVTNQSNTVLTNKSSTV